MLLDGKGVMEVAGLLKVSPSSVSRWKKAVEADGLGGLAAKPHPGPPPRLSDDPVPVVDHVLLFRLRERPVRTARLQQPQPLR